MIENAATLLKQLSQGVYVIGVGNGAHQHAFTAAWVMQVSFDPLMLAISINPEHHSYQVLQASNVCTVNVLGQDQSAVAGHFGCSVPDKMTGFEWLSSKTGAPILAESLVYFDCQVSHYAEAGDHKIAICKVVTAARLNQGQPLLYSQTGDMDGSSALRNSQK
jgi:flavin reductase (DIM6/NTAB) family NADH-FMN oxidoreductase RutF